MNKRIIAWLGIIVILATGCVKEKNDSWIQYLSSNAISNTSIEKGQNISQPFQIYENMIYFNDGEWLKRTDVNTGETINLVKKLSDEFYIENEKIYFVDYNYEDCISLCELDDITDDHKKEHWSNINSMLVLEGKFIGLRIGEECSSIIRYDGECEEKIVEFLNPSKDSNVGELVGYYNGNFYLADYNQQKIYEINENTKAIKEIFSINESKPYSYLILKVRFVEGRLFVLGTVIDTENSELGGLYYVKKAKNTGVWEISLNNNEKK